ncbi:MAG: hypothetical protein LBM70_04030 [Victivallales bacterium]|nr:hypothetical protein [Victivallales bacterium]
MNKDSGAWYALRRTLPPWKFEETLSDLIRLAPEFKIDEVIVKIDTEEFSHGHPTLEWAKRYQGNLFQVKEALQKLNIVYSLNPWITVGHCDRGRNDLNHIKGLETAVGHDGSVAKHCACFISPAWREHFVELWTIYAETAPHIMWVEDDIRTFNHEPVSFGCFCDRHMARFSERIGQKVSREQLVKAILQPGKPHPWRAEYLLMQREIMVETAGFIAKTVHKISPESCLGLMSSGPRQHCLEGRDWTKLAEALADGKQLYSRPPMCNYNEDSLRGFYYSQDSIKLTRAVLPTNTIEQSECENVPFTRFSKSTVFTFLEIAITFAYGSQGVTLNLFDHVGTPMKNEEHYGQMLSAKKPFLAALGDAVRGKGEYCGVQLLHRQDSSLVKNLPIKADYPDLGEDGFNLMQALESHGIPTVYTSSDVIAASGQVLRACSDAEIMEFLRKGMFLDGVAAGILLERGFGEYIGVKNIAMPCHRRDLPFVLSAEEFHHPGFGGEKRKYMTCTLPDLGTMGRFCVLEPSQDAQIVSSFVDPDTIRVSPAMIAYSNSLGGRVIVHAMDYQYSFGVAFCHPFRREQLHGVVDYLADRSFPLKLTCDGAYSLAFRKESGENTVIGCFNLNLDDWGKVSFDLSWTKAIPDVLLLDQSGNWVKSSELKATKDNVRLKIEYLGKISFNEPLIVKLAQA